MFYTEEDLKQAYAMGYNEAVDDVNEYIDQESMEFSLDESYDDDYSAVEDMICNEMTKNEKNDVKHTISRGLRAARDSGMSSDEVYDRVRKYKKTGDYDNDEKLQKYRENIKKYGGFKKAGLQTAMKKINMYK